MNITKSLSEGVSPVIRALLGVVLVGAILVLIKWAAPVITPIMVAGFVAALVAPLYFWLERRGVSTGLALILLVVLVVVVLLFMALLLWVSAQRVIEGVAVYQTGLEEFEPAIDSLGIRGASLGDVLSAEQLATILVTIAVWVADAVADLLFGLVLVAFMLADAKRLFTLAETELRDRPGLGNMPELAQTVVTYFGVRTRLNLLTGIGVFLLLLILGVDFALLWGVLAFLLSYVPYVGLVVAGIPPTILALAEHGVGRALIVVVGMILANMVAESILEPRMTGKALKLSPLVVIVAFFLFGWLLGATGALLSMPITVTIMLITEQDERTRWIARFMGSGEE